MIAIYTALSVLLLTALAEWLHARRIRRVAHLAFGPSGQAREWTRLIPLARVLAQALLAWGLTSLFMLEPKVRRAQQIPAGGYRHLLIVLDVSPSMQIKDAGSTGQMTRAQRASELLLSVLERTSLEQVRVSIVAFYTGAKPVVVDTFDLAVIKNVLNDLPLGLAFDIGKTTLIKGIDEAMSLARTWPEGSGTMVIVSDGDTVPDTGMPARPKSIAQVLVVGVGDPRTGKFIDGHQSRQDASTLRQVAGRLRGAYHDGNEKHLPSDLLAKLGEILPLDDTDKSGKRELILAAITVGATLLAAIPVALALAGSSWQAGVTLGERPIRSLVKGRRNTSPLISKA